MVERVINHQNVYDRLGCIYKTCRASGITMINFNSTKKLKKKEAIFIIGVRGCRAFIPPVIGPRFDNYQLSRENLTKNYINEYF